MAVRSRPIFVAGTGRSGTTQLLRVLGEHPDVYAIPLETRFLVDPGGLRDLADALTERFDPYVGDDALRRFGELMTVRMVGRSETIFKGWDLPAAVGVSRYWDALGGLWPKLVAHTFDESVPPTARTFGIAASYAPHEAERHRRVVPRYFEERGELIAILRSFVDEVFSGATAAAGRSAWAEKTPLNLLAMPFLWELFPEATIIHIKRHPERVCLSHLDQPWAPRDLDGVLAWLGPIYRRWLDFKASFDFTLYDYVEVSVEELATGWPDARLELFDALGLKDVQTASTFVSARVEGRDRTDPITRERIEEALLWAIRGMGYESSY